MELTLSKPPVTSRVNVRLVVLMAVVAVPFLYFLFIIVRQAMTGGVIDRGTYVEVDLKSLGYFPFDEMKDTLDNVPQRWRELDGKRVMLEGEMWAPNEASDDVRNFELVYSIAKCCFGGPPKVQERVFVHVPNGKEGVPNYQYRGLVRVLGKLRVNLKKEQGQATSLYEMDVESIEPT